MEFSGGIAVANRKMEKKPMSEKNEGSLPVTAGSELSAGLGQQIQALVREILKDELRPGGMLFEKDRFRSCDS